LSVHEVFNEVLGKKTHGNQQTAPSGSTRICKNYETSRDGVYRKMRGRNTYSKDITLPNSTVKHFMEYQNLLFAHYANNTIYADNGAGLFTQMLDISGGGTFTAPTTSRIIQHLNYNSNMYITSSVGVYKLDRAAGAYQLAGNPQGLNMDIRIYQSGVDWLPNNNYVAYRGVWAFTDYNNNLIMGAPSERTEVINTAGGNRSVELRVTIPDDITVNHTFMLYRTAYQATTPPEDEQLVYQAKPTVGEITAGVLVIQDITGDDFRGAKLYTNTTEEGLTYANERPPWCTTIDKFNDYVFFGDVRGLHRLYTSLISVTGLTAASTITFNNGTSNFTLANYAPNAGWAITNVTNAGAGGRIQITAVGHTLAINDYVWVHDVTGSVEANGVFEITAVAGNTFDIDSLTVVTPYIAGGEADRYEDIGATPRFLLYTALPTTAENINATARSIVRCLNQTSANTFLYGYYTSSVTDVPGKMMFTNRTMVDDDFYVIANSTATGGSFSPAIPTAGTTYVSTNDRKQNFIMWSKNGEPEHVPLVNTKAVGSSNDPILKIVALRDAVIIVKQKEGFYILTGENETSFSLDELDGTVRTLQVYSVAKGQNCVWAFTDQGFVKATSTGVEIIGQDNKYLDLKPIFNTNFDINGYAWFYEAENSYKIATMNTASSTTKDIVKVFNAITNSWRDEQHGVYTNDGHIGVGIVINGIEYTANITDRTIYKERKSLTTLDLANPDIDVTIGSIDAVNMTVTLAAPIVVPLESLLVQVVGGSTFIKDIIAINGAVLTLNNVNNLVVAAATVVPGIDSDLEYNMCHCGIPSAEKIAQFLSVYFDAEETEIENIQVILRTEVKTTGETINLITLPGNYWIKEWFSIWGTKTEKDKMLTWLTQGTTRATNYYIRIRHTAARRQVAICGFGLGFEPVNAGMYKRG